ncbi:hypothetical protein [Marinobacter subterrani]|uniref:hypothetical protein n=1 Tax=Marinobacter subterrani TaxID=1658765 RepID=UPI00235205D7|nr:hypothetical protein [Marinobacter subterrani]
MIWVQPYLPVAWVRPGHPWPVVRPSRRDVKSPLARFAHRCSPILAKAFRGELTEQWRKDNPELISGENSAAALLERIKVERAAEAKPKRRKNK